MQSLKKNIHLIYECYYKEVYGYCLKLCEQNSHLAEELTQNAFYKAILAADSFRGNCEVKTWLCQIARNDYISYLRKEKRLTKNQASQQLLESTPDPQTNILQKIEDSESVQEIQQILTQLESPYKEVFRLKILHDMDYKQIASLYQKSESWARVTFYRAKQKIMDALTQKGFDFYE